MTATRQHLIQFNNSFIIIRHQGVVTHNYDQVETQKNTTILSKIKNASQKAASSVEQRLFRFSSYALPRLPVLTACPLSLSFPGPRIVYLSLGCQHRTAGNDNSLPTFRGTQQLRATQMFNAATKSDC